MLKLFSSFLTVGIINTLIHWLIFSVLYFQNTSQSLANLIAFFCAVTFSFFANANWTFKSKATPFRYLIFVAFMGAMAAGIGSLADHTHTNPLITLIAFSFISLIFGFIYSHFIVFKVRK